MTDVTKRGQKSMTGYTILDILDRLIIMGKKGYNVYHTISLNEDMDEKIRVVARILIGRKSSHMQMYKKIRKITKKKELSSIDFDIYDQASQMISNFRYPTLSEIDDIQHLLQFALNFEKQNLALVMSIQGLLVRGLEGNSSISYHVLTEIIEEEKKHIRDIERFTH